MSQSHNVINSKIGPCLMKIDVVEQQIWTKFIQKTNNGWWIQSMLSTCELCHWNNIFVVEIKLIYYQSTGKSCAYYAQFSLQN